MTRLLVVNADDLGASDGINAGIVRAHRDGIVTSASLMVDRTAAAAAVTLAREVPKLSLGLHFEAPEQCDLDDPELLDAALERQLRRFRDLVGAEPTHLDSHHHVHLEGERMAVFAAAARVLAIPVRGEQGVHLVGNFYGQREPGVTDLAHISPAYLQHLLTEELREGFNELGCHPAARVDGLRSSYAAERLVELDTLTRPGLREAVASRGIRLASYAEWSPSDPG